MSEAAAAEATGIDAIEPTGSDTPAAAAREEQGHTPDARPLIDEAEGNAWEKATRAIRSMTSDSDAADDQKGDAADDQQAAKKDGDADKPDPSKKPEGEGDDEQETPKPNADERTAAGRTRYRVLGPDGESAGDVEWDEGTVLKFRGDGRDIEVKAFDDLVQLAQKGAAFDRQLSTKGQEVARVRSELDRVNRQADDMLMAVLFGTDQQSADDVQEKLRQELDRFRDPEFREGQEAKRREAERGTREQEEQRAAAEQLTSQVWDWADETAEAAMADFPYLDPSDAGEIKQRLYQRYATRFSELSTAYEVNARKNGVPIDQAHMLAQRDALAELSAESLRAVMQEINDRYATKAGRRNAAAAKPDSKPEAGDDQAGEDDDEPDLEAEAAEHNRRVEGKIKQRERSRTLRGGGASPSSEHSEPDMGDLSWDEKMAAMKRRLHGR